MILRYLCEDIGHYDEGEPGPLGRLVQLRLQRTVLQPNVCTVPVRMLYYFKYSLELLLIQKKYFLGKKKEPSGIPRGEDVFPQQQGVRTDSRGQTMLEGNM